MPLPVISNTYQCVLRWTDTRFPTDAVNVIHVRKSGSNAGAIATILDTNVTANMWAYQQTSSSIYEVDVTPLDGTGVTYPFTTGSPSKWKGSRTPGDTVIPSCVLMKLVTAKRGRSYRGRIYLPWVLETMQSQGVLDNSYYTTVNSAWVTFLADMAADGAPLVVASATLQTAEDVVAVALERDVATQRRRLKRSSAPAV